MKDRLQQALAKYRSEADYIEIRVEETTTTRIDFRAQDLENLSESTSYGGNVRALVKGGWGFASFNSLDGLEDQVKLAVHQASIIGQASNEKSQLAPVEPIVDQVVPELVTDPREVSLSDKVDIMRGYNERILSSQRIVSSSVRYFDRYTTLWYANTDGTFIHQEKMDLGGGMTAMAAKEGETQQAHQGFGSSNDFSVVKGLESEVDRICSTAVNLLDAPNLKGGEYTVILDPDMAGVFAHEAFGHLSESDHVYENDQLRETMKLGRQFGKKILNIFDSGLDQGARGHLVYDDEGVPTQRTELIREGQLVGRLHSRETAGKMGEEPTGNARAINYRFAPIVRMRNTRIAPGDASFEDLLSGVKDGVYVKAPYGGQTAMEMFTFVASEAYRIRNGEVQELVKNTTLSGNVFTTLGNIDAIGNEAPHNESGGGCGKGGQSPLPVSHWSPHIRIRNVVIGGKQS